jgi:2-keto-4-pentenoate hydratase/2-oxohepta-3-ene-1,7-dioic acid hydratase in catechol pathway
LIVRFVLYRRNGVVALGALKKSVLFGAKTASAVQPDLQALLAAGPELMQETYNRLLQGEEIDPSTIEYLPPLPRPEKIICFGLNYKDHASESGFEAPTYPALFGRFPSSLIGHGAPIVRPRVSEQLDYEGELVAIIGKPGRNIPVSRALEHVAGYSIFNDASVRDYQFKSTQWMIGKNFDSTGAFGPVFVSSDELQPGAKGLRLKTRLNGAEMQNASTSDMIFDVATQVSLMSDAMLLKPGDVIVTGTPSGVGLARDPKVFMKPGDVCEVQIEGIGLLSNPIVQQS